MLNGLKYVYMNQNRFSERIGASWRPETSFGGLGGPKRVTPKTVVPRGSVAPRPHRTMDITGSDGFFEDAQTTPRILPIPATRALPGDHPPWAALAALVVAQLTRGPPAECLQVDMRTRSSS